VLLVVVAFLVAHAVVKSGLGRRISLLVVSAFGRSTLGLGYSIFLTDAPDRAGVSEQYGARRRALPDHSFPCPERRLHAGRCREAAAWAVISCSAAWRALSVSSALWLTATSANPIGVSLAAQSGVKIDFGTWLPGCVGSGTGHDSSAASVPFRLFPPGATDTPDAPALAREELHSIGPLARDEWIVAVTFAVMVTGWVMGGQPAY
jgi:DASS family divalent anion:Na+ symporter